MPEYIDPSPSMTLKIGGHIVGIYFKDGSDCILGFCRAIFRPFITEAVKEHLFERILEVCLLPGNGQALFGVPEDRVKPLEFEFTPEQLAAWVDRNNGIQISDDSIGVQSLSGLLVFSPENKGGRIYLPGKDRHPYRSLYRLFWIYFAQVLGETGGCFLHAAGLAREGKGFVFIGSSGAGKSTLARLTRGSEVLSDEAPVISGYGEVTKVFSSPYHQLGVEHAFRKSLVSSGVPLDSIYFIVRDENTYIEPVSSRDAVAAIMARSIIFYPYVTPEAKAKIFDLFHRACHTLTINCLHYSIKTDIWKAIG